MITFQYFPGVTLTLFFENIYWRNSPETRCATIINIYAAIHFYKTRAGSATVWNGDAYDFKSSKSSFLQG